MQVTDAEVAALTTLGHLTLLSMRLGEGGRRANPAEPHKAWNQRTVTTLAALTQLRFLHLTDEAVASGTLKRVADVDLGALSALTCLTSLHLPPAQQVRRYAGKDMHCTDSSDRYF